MRLILFRLHDIRLHLVPPILDRVINMQIVIAKSRVPRAPEQNQLIFNIRQAHPSPRRRNRRREIRNHLSPDHFLHVQPVQIIQPLRAVPAPEYIQIVPDHRRRMVGPLRRVHPFRLHLLPDQRVHVQRVQIVQIILAISSPSQSDFPWLT